MPWEWDIKPSKAPVSAGAFSHAAGDAPLARLHLWPYRSLPRRGFVAVIGGAFLLLIIPVLALLGSALVWGILPFAMLVLALLWFFIEKSYRDAEIIEELTLWHDHISLMRRGPRGRQQHWQANPYWVRLSLHKSGGPVENYLTLKGSGKEGAREVELGAFLSEGERPALHAELLPVLMRAGFSPAGP